jgi:quercetin dioxygenase-like cupin family protein
MNADSFRERLRREGFDDIETKTIAPDTVVGLHRHAFDVLGLVLAGQAEITCGGVPRLYREGDVVDVARGVEHSERYGPQGYTVLVGRRHAPAPGA